MSNIQSSDVRAELIRRELAHRRFSHFLKYRFRQERRELSWNWHLDYLCEVMEAVARRQERRVLINMPFRSLKTETVEQTWQAWMILQDDSSRSSVLSAGAEYTLAAESSAKTLAILQSTWFQNLRGSPVFRPGSKHAANDWETAGGARRQALGIGGTVVGKGADHLCVAAGSRVLTRRGWISIQTVDADDEVATPIGWKKVRACLFTGRRSTVQIETTIGILRLTPDHLCSTPDGWRPAAAFCPGDLIHIEPPQLYFGESPGVVRPVSSRLTCAEPTQEIEDVYDLQVEDAHCFYAEGFLVHNCWGDILKPEDANSDRRRTRACTWLGETFRSRLNNQKTGTITGIMQRLHELDPAGYLLEKAKSFGADKWLLIKIEMESERRKVYMYNDFFYDRRADELLHPDRIGPKEIASLKVDLGNNYEGQCNQNPVKMKGSYFKMEWFNEYEGEHPHFTHVYQVWDYALTEESEESGDYSVCITFSLTKSGQLYIIDVYRIRMNSVDVVEATMSRALEAKAIAVFGAKGPIDKAIRPWLTKRMQEIGVYFQLIGIAETTDIVARSTPFQSMCRNGNVYMPKYARWVADWRLEFSAFPKGAHDDQVAAAAIIGLALPEIRTGEAITPTKIAVEPDRNAIYGSAVRKQLKRPDLPDILSPIGRPVPFALQLLRSGLKVTRITAEDYHRHVRKAIIEFIRVEAEGGQGKRAAMATGELARLDRKYQRCPEVENDAKDSAVLV